PWEKEDEAYGNTNAGIPNLYGLLEKGWDSHHIGKQHFFTEEKIDEDPRSKTTWVTQKTYSDWIKTNKKTKPGGKPYKDNAPEIVSGAHTRLRSYSTPEFGVYKDGINYFLDHYIASESIAAIKNRDKNKPLLLNAMFLAPHPPFSIPEPYYSMVSAKDFTLPANVGEWYYGQSPLQMYNLTGFIGSRYKREQWREIWAKYLGLVKLLDDEVGRVISALKEEGLYDKAIIVFTADHGEMLGSHSLWQKMCMYEESAKVPLIVKLPKGFQSSVKESDALVSLVDVLPTLLEYNGLPVPPKLDGRSLLPLLQGKPFERNTVFIQYDGNGSLGSSQRCVIKNNYKLIVDMFKDETFVELYDVIKDPQEEESLVFDENFTTTADELIAELSGYMERTGDRIQLPKALRENFVRNYKTSIQKSEKSQE
ncbi:MAG TPA: sulfatase-like hydrolase/transferase, partial [Agriterribacter sp.]|nr:sulfatase-like hydrolase/transferase [Agriterribacter sp.]